MSQTKAELINAKGDAAFDTNTLFVDATNNRVGIGTTSPATLVHGSASGAGARFRAQSTDASGVVVEMLSDGSTAGVISTNTNHPLVFQTNAAERMRIQSNGEINFFDNGAVGQNAFRWIRNVGTGATNSGALNLAYATVNRAPGATPSTLYWDGTTGNITIQTSSAQFKRNISDVTNEQLDKALNLRPCYFQRKEYDYWEYGFIAEEVEEAGLDELVVRVDDKVVSLDYSKISVFCIGLIKKHEEKIESLIAENAALMTRFEALEAKVAALESA